MVFLVVNNIDTKYDTDKSDLQKKISDTSGLVKNLVKKIDYNAKITEIESISISGLANVVSQCQAKQK